MVVASMEPRLLVLMINSEINQYFYMNNTDQFHVEIDAESHAFLTHDSYANCVAAHRAFDCTDLKQEIAQNYRNVFKGWLTDDCLVAVYQAVKGNIEIRRGHQREIMASIEQRLPHLHSAF
ncbi:hypothetical protein [Arenicella xantha]|nr:hypothetical protein [Arenicella xantha]